MQQEQSQCQLNVYKKYLFPEILEFPNELKFHLKIFRSWKATCSLASNIAAAHINMIKITVIIYSLRFPLDLYILRSGAHSINVGPLNKSHGMCRQSGQSALFFSFIISLCFHSNNED